MINVDGNYKQKLKKGYAKTKKYITKKTLPSAAKTYKSYVAPTVGLFKSAANIATGVGKLALRNPLLAAGTYVASKGFNPKGKFSKGRKFNEFGDAGKVLSKGGKKIFYG